MRRQRELYRALVTLAGDRHERETSTAREYEESGAAAQTEHEEARRALEQGYRADLKSTEEAYRERKKKVRTEGRTEYRGTEHAQVADRESIRQKAGLNETEARKKLDEAIWVAETVFEAGEDKPELQYRTREKVVEARREELMSASEQARMLLRKYRQRAVGVETDEEPEPVADESPDETLHAVCEAARDGLLRLRRLRVARLFRGYLVPLQFVLLLGAAAAATAWWQQWQVNEWIAIIPGATLVVLLGLFVGLYFLARRSATNVYRPLRSDIVRGLATCDRCVAIAAAERDRLEGALLDQRDAEIRAAKEKYEPIIEEIGQRRTHHLKRISEKYPTKLEAIEHRCEQDLQEADAEHERTLEERRAAYARESGEIDARYATAMEHREARHARQWETLERDWMEGMTRCAEAIDALQRENAHLFPAWDDGVWQGWKPPTDFAPSIRYGTLGVDRGAIDGGIPTDPRLEVPVAPRFDLPATLDFPDRCSMLLLSGGDGRQAAVQTLQTVMFRLLTDLPPGKVRFTIMDPVGLGRSFAGFMHLADYDESFVNGRIWTDARHIEQRLADLTEHMETVIQKYLRNEFETIAEYNEYAGEIAEPYRFLVIADFPGNFSDAAARRLASVISSGARCGVYTLIAVDMRQALPKEIALEDLERHSVTLVHGEQGYAVKDEDFGKLPLQLEAPPSEVFLTEKLHLIGEAAKDATRVEVPFEVVAPPPDKAWSLDCTKTLRIPLGRSGATKFQHLELGQGTSQHVLIAGKTGSGKSTLLHVLITNIALWYSPDEVQFYLVDFKKGVEFKTYAAHNLAHAKAVAVESDREFGLSVLQRIDAELRHRGDRFRELGVQDLGGYRRLGLDVAMPRILLIVDEFQEMFVEDDKLGQDAALLMDRLVRQGRAFGIHVLLGSQTLGGAYTLARSTMGQMQVRIALQCSEADSYLIMSDDNAAARLLGRPGEAIYNDQGGAVQGNSPFQIVWLADEERERQLRRAEQIVTKRDYRRPEPQIVFEGNAAADLDGNHLLRNLIEGPAATGTDGPAAPLPRVWLGEAIAIKDPTVAAFRRQSGNNLLIVGQQDEAAMGMCAGAIISLAARSVAAGGDGARMYVLDGCPTDSVHAGYLQRVTDGLPVDVRHVKWREVEPAMQELAAELKRREEEDATDAPPLYIIVYGLQRFRMLRAGDDLGFSFDADKPPSPDRQFADLLRDGSQYGIHTVAWCDTATNLNRSLDRNGLREFEMRVMFQMSGADSTGLIDSPAAGKLGLRRALYYNEEEGVLEKFRPYALPEESWIADVRERLGKRARG
ncbi:MAG: cell division protein FtsK [Planctomycetes bacterium]|nr:cell division protein FtsK [Planctomycetota bacterium]